MFLALREIWHAKLRFALITLVIVMVSSLVFIISGLANGLSEGNTAAIEALPANGIVVSAGSDYQLDRSTIKANDASSIASLPGIEAAELIGISSASVKSEASDSLIGVSLFGVDPAGMVAPSIDEGTWIGDTTNGVVIDESLAKKGIGVGDSLVLEPEGIELDVTGIVSGQSYRIAPVIFMPLELWQSARAAGGGYQESTATAVLVKGSGTALVQIPTAVPDTMVGSKKQVSDHIPGESEQNSTLLLIQIFLVVIAAGIIAAFFYIITLQKMPELGVMKAIGTGTGYLAKALVSQVFALALVGVLLGISISDTLALVIGDAVPYSVSMDRMALFGSLLLLVALASTLLSLLRIARIDPLDAINRTA